MGELFPVQNVIKFKNNYIRQEVCVRVRTEEIYAYFYFVTYGKRLLWSRRW